MQRISQCGHNLRQKTCSPNSLFESKRIITRIAMFHSNPRRNFTNTSLHFASSRISRPSHTCCQRMAADRASDRPNFVLDILCCNSCVFVIIPSHSSVASKRATIYIDFWKACLNNILGQSLLRLNSGT